MDPKEFIIYFCIFFLFLSNLLDQRRHSPHVANGFASKHQKTDVLDKATRKSIFLLKLLPSYKSKWCENSWLRMINL